MATFGRGRGVGLGLLTTGVVCPCHVLVGVASLLTGGALLSPAAQDGLHAVYAPFAVLAGAFLLRRGSHGKVLGLRMMEDDRGGAVLGVEIVRQAQGEPDL
jgi:hypothetical protein